MDPAEVTDQRDLWRYYQSLFAEELDFQKRVMEFENTGPDISEDERKTMIYTSLDTLVSTLTAARSDWTLDRIERQLRAFLTKNLRFSHELEVLDVFVKDRSTRKPTPFEPLQWQRKTREFWRLFHYLLDEGFLARVSDPTIARLFLDQHGKPMQGDTRSLLKTDKETVSPEIRRLMTTPEED